MNRISLSLCLPHYYYHHHHHHHHRHRHHYHTTITTSRVRLGLRPALGPSRPFPRGPRRPRRSRARDGRVSVERRRLGSPPVALPPPVLRARTPPLDRHPHPSYTRRPFSLARSHPVPISFSLSPPPISPPRLVRYALVRVSLYLRLSRDTRHVLRRTFRRFARSHARPAGSLALCPSSGTHPPRTASSSLERALNPSLFPSANFARRSPLPPTNSSSSAASSCSPRPPHLLAPPNAVRPQHGAPNAISLSLGFAA